MNSIYFNAFLGGIIIGISTVILLLFSGRVAGNSGIIAGLFRLKKDNAFWKLFYVVGLLFGGIVYLKIQTPPDTVTFSVGPGILVIAGLLVGFGTRLGSGCTSGHGICGMSRFSARSVIATCIFMASAIATVFILRLIGVIS